VRKALQVGREERLASLYAELNNEAPIFGQLKKAFAHFPTNIEETEPVGKIEFRLVKRKTVRSGKGGPRR